MRCPEVELTLPKARVLPLTSARERIGDATEVMNLEWNLASSSRCNKGTAFPVRRCACTKVKPPYQTRSRFPPARPSTVAG
jgi:hypothetical protein